MICVMMRRSATQARNAASSSSGISGTAISRRPIDTASGCSARTSAICSAALYTPAASLVTCTSSSSPTARRTAASASR